MPDNGQNVKSWTYILFPNGWRVWDRLYKLELKNLVGSMSTRSTSISKDPNVAQHLSFLHDRYVIVSADNAPNNIVFVSKSVYVDCLIKKLGIDNSLGNPTYTPTTLTKEEILDNHRSVLCSFGISIKDEELDLLSLYWIPKFLWKCLYQVKAHCDFLSFPVVDWFCLFVDLWVLPFPLEDCSVFGNFVITLIYTSVLTNSVILLGLPNTPRSLFPNY
jgi:hypothetical protein